MLPLPDFRVCQICLLDMSIAKVAKFHVAGLALTVSYDEYHQDNHDPDHDPCQVAQEDDEEQADEHGNNQTSAQRERKQRVSELMLQYSNRVTRKQKQLQMSVSYIRIQYQDCV